ncbi:mitochondrial chaperone bcs1 [Lecanosticta acicola]|uniref:Mitochondrial chaperone bcs1 n=1 Tax=Lecanosticta acicola TaxID=111012 RepID=A0AAI8Z811_9PEZI|nr:mitochondrial chaperone bcs1 [Lecanosticta acicola]
MDFRRLTKALPTTQLEAGGNNSTETLDITNLPSNILEALIPGYGLISRSIASTFGIDISIFVSIGLILFALVRGGQYLFGVAENVFRDVFMASVYIDEHDDLFDMVMGWLAEHQGAESRRSVRAKTQYGAREGKGGLDDGAVGDALGENGLFDYNKWSARTPPRFEPYYGRHMLWHGGRLFFFRRSQRPANGQRVQVSFGSTKEDDVIQLDCIGRSTEPIRELLRTIKIWSLDRLRNTTTIRHPTPKDRGRWAGAWSKTTSRPSRPMETVILDSEQKKMIIKDMNEYLHPSSPKWYATRGIPYRRGYLFHGPPGTGKTSLSFALAGIFGLEIYAISLQEPTLSEGDLMQLFNGLPRRCIVLLEDVDAAGLLRDGKSGSDEKAGKKKGKDGKREEKKIEKKGETEKDDKKQEKPKKDEDYTLKDLAKELKSISAPSRGGRGGNAAQGGHPNREAGAGISLSGLLNAIDGVATHEGRCLIMTTNLPEKLDAALVRPGRVDRKVAFKLAMKDQISELFVRMYAATDQVPEFEPKIKVSDKPTTNGYTNGHRAEENQLTGLREGDLELLSLEFARCIPDDTFTPAEIQNHLMRYKKQPRTAVEEAKEWAEELLAEKEKEAEEKAEAAEDEEEGED